MQSMTFHPVVGDIGGQVIQMGISSLGAGQRASLSITGLMAAGSDEVSMQAAAAFQQEATALLDLHRAAQEELMRTGTALTQIARTYTDADEAAANSLALRVLPISA